MRNKLNNFLNKLFKRKEVLVEDKRFTVSSYVSQEYLDSIKEETVKEIKGGYKTVEDVITEYKLRNFLDINKILIEDLETNKEFINKLLKTQYNVLIGYTFEDILTSVETYKENNLLGEEVFLNSILMFLTSIRNDKLVKFLNTGKEEVTLDETLLENFVNYEEELNVVNNSYRSVLNKMLNVTVVNKVLKDLLESTCVNKTVDTSKEVKLIKDLLELTKESTEIRKEVNNLTTLIISRQVIPKITSTLRAQVRKNSNNYNNSARVLIVGKDLLELLILHEDFEQVEDSSNSRVTLEGTIKNTVILCNRTGFIRDNEVVGLSRSARSYYCNGGHVTVLGGYKEEVRGYYDAVTQQLEKRVKFAKLTVGSSTVNSSFISRLTVT